MSPTSACGTGPQVQPDKTRQEKGKFHFVPLVPLKVDFVPVIFQWVKRLPGQAGQNSGTKLLQPLSATTQRDKAGQKIGACPALCPAHFLGTGTRRDKIEKFASNKNNNLQDFLSRLSRLSRYFVPRASSGTKLHTPLGVGFVPVLCPGNASTAETEEITPLEKSGLTSHHHLPRRQP